MQFLYSTRQIKRTLWQIPAILLLSIVVGLISNAVRKQHLPIIGDWSNKGRVVTESGDTLAIPFSEAVRYFKQKTAIFIDARDEEMFEEGHIQGAVNLPWHDVDNYFMDFVKDIRPTDRIIIYCDGETCNLSHDLALFLIDMGFLNTKVLVNGWTLWIDNNLPVEKEE